MTLEQFWSDFEYKTWVVNLMAFGRRSKLQASEKKYVRAKTEAGAIRTARHYSFMPAGAHASARLAHPVRDLECVWNGDGPFPLG